MPKMNNKELENQIKELEKALENKKKECSYINEDGTLNEDWIRDDLLNKNFASVTLAIFFYASRGVLSLNTNEISKKTGIGWTLTDYYLKKLEEIGWVKIRRRGQGRHNIIRPERYEEIIPFLDIIQKTIEDGKNKK